MKIEKVLEEKLPLIGYECIDFNMSQNGTLTIYIDKEDRQITIDDCVKVNDYLNKIFLVENINYNRLEISSPGIDRIIKKEKDFLKYIGHLIKINTKVKIDGQNKFKGKLLNFNSKTIDLELKNKDILNIEFKNIDKARLNPDI